MSPFRVQGDARRQMERELELYMAALNIDTQYAVRKCVFLIRSLQLPEELQIKEALRQLEERLAVAREEARLGRPWTYMQLRRLYWTTATRFIRRPVMPMTPKEWKSYQPTMMPEECKAAHAAWLKMVRVDHPRRTGAGSPA